MPRPRRRLAPFPIAALGLYLALAVAVFWTPWTSPAEKWIGGGPDPPLFMWHLRWLPFALGDGHNPLYSDYLNYPDGFNLMWNTSVIFPAFLLGPITLLFGAIVSYNVLSTIALALSAWCAYLVIRRYVRSPIAAAIGGLLYGFSPFMLVQASGHPHMTFAVYPPLVLLLLDEILVRQRRSPLLLGTLLGAATGLQVLTGEEIVAITFIAACLGVVVLALLYRQEVRTRLSYTAHAVAVAGLVALAIDAYPLWVQLTGTQTVSGPVHAHGVFVSDLLAFVVPGPGQQLTFDAANDLHARFSGPSELGSYVGLPLLLFTAFVLVRHWSDRFVRFLGLLLGAVVILSFGPRIQVAGHALSLPLPWVIPQRLPLFDSVLPVRFALIMFLLLGLLLAVFVDRFPSRSRARTAALAALFAIVLAPLLPSLPFPSDRDDTPRFFSAGAEAISKDRVALVAPLASVAGGTSRPMVWQARADMRFRQPAGYIRGRARFESLGRDSPLFSRMIDIQAGKPMSPVTLAARRAILCQLARLRVASVVVGPMKIGRRRTSDLFRRMFERAPTRTGGVELWPDVLVAARRGGGGCA